MIFEQVCWGEGENIYPNPFLKQSLKITWFFKENLILLHCQSHKVFIKYFMGLIWISTGVESPKLHARLGKRLNGPKKINAANNTNYSPAVARAAA